MVKRLVKGLTNNMGLKLLALLFSVVMWMAVVNLDDPQINRTFTVAVTVENETAITSQDKYYEIAEDSRNVTFSVSGKRSIVDKLSSSDFKATADMSQMIQQNNKNTVPIEVTALRYSSQLTISRRSQILEVFLEDLMKAQFVVQANATGTPADGYALGDMSVTPNLLKVSGPKNVVSQIVSVKANVDISGMSAEINDSVVPALLDENGETIDTTQLTLNLNTVTVNAQILSQKLVSVKAGYTGTPAEGYEVISLSANPEQIQIKGDMSVLNSISMITIPKDVIQVDDVDRKFDQQVDISKYLPDGVSLTDSAQATVTITVDVEQLERETFSVPVENIEIDNLPEGYHIEYNKHNVEFVIYGLKKDLDELKASKLRPVLDVSGMAAGSHVGQLSLTLEDAYIVADTTISYTIITNDTASATEQTQEGAGQEEVSQEEAGQEEAGAEDTTADQIEDAAEGMTDDTADDVTEDTADDAVEETVAEE